MPGVGCSYGLVLVNVLECRLRAVRIRVGVLAVDVIDMVVAAVALRMCLAVLGVLFAHDAGPLLLIVRD
jgi:hypothetical protein